MPPRCAEAKLAATFPRRAERRRDAVKLRSGRRPVRGEQSNATPPTRKRESSRFPAAPNLSLPSLWDGPLRKQGQRCNQRPRRQITSAPSRNWQPLSRGERSDAAPLRRSDKSANPCAAPISSLPSHWDGPRPARTGGVASSTRAAIKPRTAALPPPIAAKPLAAAHRQSATANRSVPKRILPNAGPPLQGGKENWKTP